MLALKALNITINIAQRGHRPNPGMVKLVGTCGIHHDLLISRHGM